MISIVNYHAGNAPSVMYALNYLGIACELVSNAAELERARKIILPGVGSAGATMDSLRDSGLITALEQKVMRERVPFLGICIGQQIIFEHSEEGDVACLGWLKGKVARFPASCGPVPQIGWNDLRLRRAHPFAEGVRDGAYVYFVNSYFVKPADDSVVLGTTDYGGVEFCSTVSHENILATQFHVEKSGPIGLRMLSNFARL